MTILFLTKILITLFTALLIPIYWKNYGPQNFLWLSDIGLFMTVLGLWFHSSLIISMAVIGILTVEVAWIVDFFYVLLTRKHLLGLTDYMFDSQNASFLRALSLFHIAIPIIWITCVVNWGYDREALLFQIILIWTVFPLTYLLTDPKENINWVFLPKARHWNWMPPLAWLILLMVGYPLVIIIPAHLLLSYAL